MAAGRWDPGDDRLALEILRPLLDAGGYLPWTEGALRPAALVRVANEIVLGERETVVELGSGVSTIVLARLLRERGGSLVSLEHELAWARVVRRQLEREGLAEIAGLIAAPLEAHPLALDAAPWYAASAVAELPGEIDLLLVDGPPGYGEGMERSRYPALPALADRLAPGAMVILDDAERPGEREILERWSQEPSRWSFATDASTGLALGTAP